MIGLGRFGSALAATLVDLGYEVLGVDTNPTSSRTSRTPCPSCRPTPPTSAPSARSRAAGAADGGRVHQHRDRGRRTPDHCARRPRREEHLGEGDHPNPTATSCVVSAPTTWSSPRPTWVSGSLTW
ncbi:MAG: hypothetical protein R2697_03135 [Ilumatobacteraceae bacterium]